MIVVSPITTSRIALANTGKSSNGKGGGGNSSPSSSSSSDSGKKGKSSHSRGGGEDNGKNSITDNFGSIGIPKEVANPFSSAASSPSSSEELPSPSTTTTPPAECSAGASDPECKALSSTTTPPPPPLSVAEANFPVPPPPILPDNYDLQPSYTIRADGSIVQQGSGEITTWLPDETITRRSQWEPSAWQEKWSPIQTSEAVLWKYSLEKPTGYKFTKYPDRAIEQQYPNGRVHTVLLDGTQIDKEPLPGSKFTVTTTLPDKTKITKDPDGKTTTYDPDGKWQQIVFPKKSDGSFDTYYPDGRTVNTKP